MRDESPDECLTPDQCHEIQRRIGAFSYVECSAKNITGINQVFEEAVLAVETFERIKNANNSKKCQIL